MPVKTRVISYACLNYLREGSNYLAVAAASPGEQHLRLKSPNGALGGAGGAGGLSTEGSSNKIAYFSPCSRVELV